MLLFNPNYKIGNILIILGGILILGFVITKLTRRLKLPDVTGYIILGFLINLIIKDSYINEFVDSSSFVSDIALSFIAFGTGKFFLFKEIKKDIKPTLVITILEATLAGAFIFILMYFIFKMSLAFSLVLAAIATSTAPASTLMTIKQYDARGDFVKTLLQVVALDDIICLVFYSICICAAADLESNSLNIVIILKPILFNLLFMALGVAFGFILKPLMNNITKEKKLILISGTLILSCGVCNYLDISPMLFSMILGITYRNVASDDEIFDIIDSFTPPILCFFFVRSGIALDIKSLKVVGIIGVCYFIVRIIGKYLGALLGSLVTKRPKEITKYLGFALIPQAGVSIGLAFMGQRVLNQEMGNMLLTIILASSILYELIGPPFAKLSLFLSGSIKKKDESYVCGNNSKLEIKYYDKKWNCKKNIFKATIYKRSRVISRNW